MVELHLWGALLRFSQVLIQAAPTILVGLLVTGILRRLLGADRTRKLFGAQTWRALPQAWTVAMLLPVCSLGVIPIMREMRRVGISGGTVLAFGLTAPLFNPISVLYGLTLSDPVVIITFAFCSLVIVTACGLICGRLLAGAETPGQDFARVPHGIKRIMAVLVVGVRELAGPTSVYILVGLLGVAAISVFLPYGSLQMAAEHDDPWAPLFMTGVAIPVYATPMVAMVQLASMFQHGNSVGAAFALLVLGAGANLGLLAFLARTYGARRSLAWFVSFVGMVLLLAYSLDKPLYPTGVEPVGHTHAFDTYCSPFKHPTNYSRVLVDSLRQDTAPHDVVGIGLLAAAMFGAIVLAVRDPGRHTERWLEREPRRRPRFDRELPASVVGGVALVGLVVLSLMGCYLYYPPVHEVFEELKMANTELASSAISQDWDTAEHWIPICDDWSRKLEVGLVIRGGAVTPEQRSLGHLFREKLDELGHAVEDRDGGESKALALAVNQAYRNLRGAYMTRRQHSAQP